jgi:hypothetical protein
LEGSGINVMFAGKSSLERCSSSLVEDHYERLAIRIDPRLD